jgi:AraC-like DNA-binding protein
VLRYREVRPSAALGSFVDAFWVLEQDPEHSEAGAPTQRVVPDGHPEIILNLGQPFEFFDGARWHGQPRCFLAGQIDGPLLLRPNGRANILGIRFHPHGVASVLEQPMHELPGQFTPVADLSPALARDLDRALDSAGPITRIEAALLTAERTSRGYDPAVAEAGRRIILDRGASDLAALARELGVGIRQFERRFNHGIGLPPKLFCRMQRFIHVFRAISEQPCKWADAAIECGYYDQAHLIRDFRTFSGETPAALLAEDTDLARHFLERFGVSHSYNTAKGKAL